MVGHGSTSPALVRRMCTDARREGVQEVLLRTRARVDFKFNSRYRSCALARLVSSPGQFVRIAVKSEKSAHLCGYDDPAPRHFSPFHSNKVEGQKAGVLENVPALQSIGASFLSITCAK